jgi:predicted nucleic-acid-binding protein
MTTRTVDTNVLVRLLVRDDSEQWAKVADIAKRFRFVVLPIVLLEIEWVLRSRFNLDRAYILHLLRALAASEGIVLVDRERVLRAIGAFAQGMDFADAMHVSFTADGATFLTFDRDLVRSAGTSIDHASVELAS